MTELRLTGLASEQDLLGEQVKYFLVFNNGKLKIEVTAQTTEEVVKIIYSDEKSSSDFDPEPQNNEQTEHGDNQDEDGVSQI